MAEVVQGLSEAFQTTHNRAMTSEADDATPNSRIIGSGIHVHPQR